MYVQSTHHHQKFKKQPLVLEGSIIQPKDKVRNLGVLIDQTLSMKSHVSFVVSSCENQLRKLGRVRRNLTSEASHCAVRGAVLSRIDYCNSLLAGLGPTQIHRLQLIQNKAARIISRTKKYDSISPVISSLHWLTVHKRIKYKILVLAYKSLHNTAPGYLRQLIPDYQPTRQLRSASASNLQTKIVRKKIGEGAFSVIAPKLWNQLPLSLKNSKTLTHFRKSLKTYLF